MTAINLRELTEADIPAVIEVWIKAWTAAMPAIDFEERRGYFANRLAQHCAEGAHRLVAVAADGSPRGLLVVNPATRYLDQIAVVTSEQGTGLAGRLLIEAQRLSPDGLSLHVNQDNPRAIRFYEKNGWRRGEASINPRSGLPIWLYHWP
jgi:putative acetyltransferase